MMKQTPTSGESFEEIWQRRMARRSFLKGALATAPVIVAGPAILESKRARRTAPFDGLTFSPISLSTADHVEVPPGYQSRALLRWGDPILPGGQTFNIMDQTPAMQQLQFGYNCDFLAFFSLPQHRSQNPVQGLLCVNHEYTNPELMFPNYIFGAPTAGQVDIEIAAHGLSIVEINHHPRTGWEYRQSSLNRRITGETEIEITGPAAGADLLKVSYDPTGTRVRGMLNNCGGGKTPWGTLLTAEENFNQYFARNNSLPETDPRRAMHARYGLTGGSSSRRWENIHSRFDIPAEPNEPFRFGYIVEIDPYDPGFTPKKRTAIGRFKHEAATVVIGRTGRAVVYSGDDERFQLMYKFVSSGRYNPADRTANFSLLDSGTLYAAKFNDDGSGEWLPVIAGQGPLAGWSEAEVLIDTRLAASLVGATRMDRPEDIETNPVNGKVYCAMTNNTNRGIGINPGTDAANPRPANRDGHIIELTESGNDHEATDFTWEIFMLCGNPAVDTTTFFAGFDPSLVSPISSPDNILFDKLGNLWIATDGQINTFQANDGIFAVPTQGPDRGYLRQFLSGVPGGEVASLEFSPNNETLFASIQHPGEDSDLSAPTSLFPDNTNPPRPSVVAVQRVSPGRKTIGS